MITHIQGKLVEKTPTYVVVDCSGIKNNEYKTITAEDKAIAAITFFESIIFLL